MSFEEHKTTWKPSRNADFNAGCSFLLPKKYHVTLKQFHKENGVVLGCKINTYVLMFIFLRLF